MTGNPTVIIPRRNFLIRALGFTAGGATMTLPLVTVADAKARIGYHTKELKSAFRDYYAGLTVRVASNGFSSEDVRERDEIACLLFTAARPDGGPVTFGPLDGNKFRT